MEAADGTIPRRAKKKRVGNTSARELYALIVGEGGVAPEYFMNVMTGDEAADYVVGLRRRHREMWEAARIGWYVQCASEKVKSPQDLYKFPWDEKPKRTRTMKKDLEALKEKAKAFENELNKQRNG